MTTKEFDDFFKSENRDTNQSKDIRTLENNNVNQPKKLSLSYSSMVPDISTYRKHGMDYFTRDGVILRTGFSNMIEWFLLCIRELLDNAIDFLTKNYQGEDNTIITVEIIKDDNFFRLKVRNSNDNNLKVFCNKSAIFDYNGRYGSKQDLHIISRGMLGDAQKQILAFGYILTHIHDDGSGFEEKQWEEPLIIRHNGKEYKIFLRVDKARQVEIVRGLDEATGEVPNTDTEIELTLPIPDGVKTDLNRICIEDFCKKYPLFTTDITFRFQITDNSSYESVRAKPAQNLDSQIPITVASRSPMATIKIQYNALHQISKEPWYKQNTIHSYTAEEFKGRLVNMDPQQAFGIRVYNFLTTYREGSNIRRNSENDISVAQLLSLQDKARNKK